MKKTTLTNEAVELYKRLCECRDRENQSTEYYKKLKRACSTASKRWSRRHENALNSGCEVIVNKSNAGRPTKEDKKIQVGIKLPPWLNEWMKRQSESKAKLIETALVAYYQIPDHLNPDKQG